MKDREPVGHRDLNENSPDRIAILMPPGVMENSVLRYLFTENPESARFLFENPDLARIAIKHSEVAEELFNHFKPSDSEMSKGE